MLKFLSKLFGSKSERDIKAVQPIVEKIKSEYEQLSPLSDDELRGKTADFKNRIKGYLADIDKEISTLKAEAEDDNLDMSQKTAIYESVDKLSKDRDKKLEEVLMDILPEAFAVVKETSRRLAENKQLVVTATDFDRELAAQKQNVVIEGNQATWKNVWLAAGTEVTWNMVHYDVQLIGGVVLHQGKIAQMATGEGKTLVGTLPTYLNALAGNGVHIVTVNDYLARRDSEWNAPLFEFHGLSVDCIDKHQPNSPQRRKAYASDIVYGTNNEFGFDYLRDNMTQTPDALVQGKLHFAMVDEVDSVLIDDARTPLIISGPIPRGDQHEFYQLKPRIERLVNAQKAYINTVLNEAKKAVKAGDIDPEKGGLALFRAYRGLPKNKALIKYLSEDNHRQILQKVENYYMQEQNKNMPKADAELFFVIDEKNNQVELTEKGIELITASGEDPSFFILPDVGSEIADIEKADIPLEEKAARKEELLRDYSIKAERIHSINQLLKAYTLFENDVEYIVDEGKVKIVDEQTGRIMDGRRYSDGLHQAIEAKENVKVEDATQTYATITLQNYFRMYHKLAGMTGTASTEAGELWEIYKLDVVEIPTNRVALRDDRQDFIYRTAREKYNAVAEEIQKLTEAGRPVLVGTTSVEISELLSRMLQLRKVKHNVLNAKLHQKEADIVAEAGQPGQVTIATNMAGRGTDIKLTDEVKAAGGLAIIGTERHESRRVDRQLRGRAGRQGDPGSSQFFVSLEDNLMRLFASERISNIMVKMGVEEGEVMQHSMLTKSIERAQRKVEENNFGIRKRLLEYDDVMNSQRTVIYTKRKNALFGERLDVDLNNMIFDVVEEIVVDAKEGGSYEDFQIEVIRIFAVNPEISEEEFTSLKIEALTDRLFDQIINAYHTKLNTVAAHTMPVLQNVFEERGNVVENVVIPFSDGLRGIQVATNLKKAIETEGREVFKSFEKGIVLALIDEAWKEHLREMDDLKQSVQNAVYEQKDPIIIYKMEAFNLFKSMLATMNKDIVSFIFKGEIPGQNMQSVPERSVQAAPVQVKATKAELESPIGVSAEDVDTRDLGPTQPIRNENAIGRNDDCPCGSGKKYKNCHGVNS
ncbi:MULTISPECIES: preprotein translocase subunit SecA [Sphingobacterium]|uniref:Protein translocase subunit SecA n=1 Tax=Sphingobacterium anhuiense TaxID=493780 RepID=A0ABW5Z007_9SPHI|nr:MULTISPECIES: preprotein translocase subunit SecA [Sphingobacterium]MBB2954565.1 preprotein translocase subunit SecA [Sphingobacterium sp. JUb56]MCS3556685.1 preprotein translocase subunit SecA [Sphingobacterium sp. JUb21]MCW2261787.1 preprotein translocase subunit SecA [Sphingobacterium kitahiroshimense]NJI75514.1 preprotein translocase subunit SecA [Sphingobacterium sp. B16(2022)]QQD15145.1 preprotein translocase subunit SecA [Sphingobacterium sp. UDSM-2020]